MVCPVLFNRSRRFADENNSEELGAGWGASIKASWQSLDKGMLWEAYATNLLKKDAASQLGVNAVWRF